MYKKCADDTVEEKSVPFSPNLNALVAISKGTRAVKLCINKIIQFLTGGAGYSKLTCIMAVKSWLLLLPYFIPCKANRVEVNLTE